jgi:hypothetical protein
MEKIYALFWMNGDNFVDIVIDTTGKKTDVEILEEIGKTERSWDDSCFAYYLVEKDPIIV